MRLVCRVPHRGRATNAHAHPQPHPHLKTVCLKICRLGCSNLGRTDLLNLHYLVLLHLLSRRCGFLRGLLSHLRITIAAPELSFSATFGSSGVDSSSGSVLMWCCRTRKTLDTSNPSPHASREAAKRTRVERAERGEHRAYIQRHNRRLRANPLERIVLMCNAHLCTFRVRGSHLRPHLRPAMLLPGL